MSTATGYTRGPVRAGTQKCGDPRTEERAEVAVAVNACARRGRQPSRHRVIVLREGAGDRIDVLEAGHIERSKGFALQRSTKLPRVRARGARHRRFTERGCRALALEDAAEGVIVPLRDGASAHRDDPGAANEHAPDEPAIELPRLQVFRMKRGAAAAIFVHGAKSGEE